jgi:hypothetical protein
MKYKYLFSLFLTSCLAQPDSSLLPLEPECLLKIENKQEVSEGVHKFSINTFNATDLLYGIVTLSDKGDKIDTFWDFKPIGDLDVAYHREKGNAVRYLDVENKNLQELHTLVLESFTHKYCNGEVFFNSQQYSEFQKKYENFKK